MTVGGGLDRVQAEFRLPAKDLGKDLRFFTETLGFRLETIFPSDNPAVAVLSGHGLRIRLERGAREAPGTIRILCHDTAAFFLGKGSGEPDGKMHYSCDFVGHGASIVRCERRFTLDRFPLS